MDLTCTNCAQDFVISDDDLAFYKNVSPTFDGKTYEIPPPTLCPLCRNKKRYIWRPELIVFPRKSDKSGKSILSLYPEDAPVTVYGEDEWWSDDWDPLEYGRDFDFDRPFFDQLKELIQEVPLIARGVFSNENCDYINNASYCKNCYLIAGCNYDENCYYGNYVNRCNDCTDCCFIVECELCYECIDSQKCQRLQYSQQCSNCHDSAFLFHCRGCRSCFGSVNLVNREYVFFNEQLSREEYEKRIEDVELHKRSRRDEVRKHFESHKLQFPHRCLYGEQNEEVTGNAISRSRNSTACFDASGLEDCHNCAWLHSSKNCRDHFAWGFSAEECLECVEVGDGINRTMFSVTIFGGSNVYYSYTCLGHCAHLFGCVGLRKKEYCILNKKYSKEEYEKLVSKIIEHMQRTGEWGQFLPYSVCPIAYNQSVAQEYFPITEEEAENMGAKWAPEPEYEKKESLLPDTIAEIPEGISQEVLSCAVTGKPYKLIEQELAFYRDQNIPPPNKCFTQRHRERLARRNPRMLFARECSQCQKKLETSYAPERPEKVVCEECFLKEVY